MTDALAMLRILRWIGRYLHGIYLGAGLLLSVGLVLAVLGLWGFSLLTEGVLEGDTEHFDSQILLWLNSHASPWLDRAALEVTALGDTLVIIVLGAVTAALLFVLDRRAYALLIVMAISGAGVINPVLKVIFDRPRPQVFEWRAHYTATTQAYPSGHAAMSVVAFATLAFVFYRLSGSSRVGALAAFVAAGATILVGLSRLYLGVHYPSDVAAGYAIGFAWAVLCAATIEAAQHRVADRSA